jgi:acetyltransferase-like isoleucine patch superfamily enzyme
LDVHWLDRLFQRWDRHVQLWRGDLIRLRGAQAGQRFGVGPNVRILHPSCLVAGHDVTIVGSAYISGESTAAVRVGDCTEFHTGLWIRCTGTGSFRIGSHCFVQAYCVIGAGHGNITVGDHVILGQMVNLQAGNHIFADATQRIDQQGTSHKGIVIEDDCWIGAQATVLDGVTLGQGCVIGAGSVVTRSIPPYSVAVGSPARVIRKRT